MSFKVNRIAVTSGVLLLVASLTACVSHKAQENKVVVFPPAPEKPRFYFERSLRTSTDVQGISLFDKIRITLTGSAHVVDGLVKPFAVAAHKGRVYITDTVARSIKVFDLTTNKYFEMGTGGKGLLRKPLGIDANDTGVYVIDNTAKRVVVFHRDGKFLRAFGNKDIFTRPSGIAVSSDALVYVVDTGGVASQNHKVHVFDGKTGEFLRSIGRRGQKPGEFNLPLQAAVGPKGNLHVVDSGNFRVQVLSPAGNFIQSIGSIGRRSGQFSRPKGISVDKNGNIYVIDTGFGNFQIFSNKGQLLLFVGQRGGRNAPGRYMLPAGIDVDEDGRIYVVDQYFRKVDIFRPASLGAKQGYAALKD